MTKLKQTRDRELISRIVAKDQEGVKVLLAAGARPERSTEPDTSPIDIAESYGLAAIAEMLKDALRA